MSCHLLLLSILLACGENDTGGSTAPTQPTNTATECIDADADGVCAEDDCNDDYNLAYEGAPEIPYNGLDEDCDGESDEDLLEDAYEVLEMRQSNDRCEVSHSLGTSESGQPPITVNQATLYHADQSADVDWYSVSSTDALGACIPTRGQCIRFVVEFIHPENVDSGDYELCAHEPEPGPQASP